MMFSSGTKKSFSFLLAFWLMSALTGCAEKPDQVVAYNEDANLIDKTQLEGEHTLDSLNAAMKQIVFNGNGEDNIEKAYSESLLTSPQEFSLTDKEKLKLTVEVNTNYLLVFGNRTGNEDSKIGKEFLFGYKITHYDLVPKKTNNGEETRYLVKDQIVNQDPNTRRYLMITNKSDVLIPKDDDTVKDIYVKKSDYIGKTFKLNEVEGLIGLSGEVRYLIKQSFKNISDETTVKVVGFPEKIELVNTADNTTLAIMKLGSANNYVDLVQVYELVNGKEELSPNFAEAKENLWNDRAYINISRDAFKLPADKYLASNVVDKAILDGKSFTWNGTADNILADLGKDGLGNLNKYSEGIKNALEKTGVPHGTIIEFILTESKLTLIDKKTGKFIMQFDVEHYDILPKISAVDGSETGEFEYNSTKNKWKNRKYISIKINNFNIAEHLQDSASVNGLRKDLIIPENESAEYVYVSTITEISEENGFAFVGKSVDSKTRLKFEVTENELRAVEIGNALNTNGKPKTFINFPITSHFDIQYRKNALDEDTHIQEENTTDRDWNQRDFIRVDFTKSNAPSLYNDIMSHSRLGYSRRIKTTGTTLVGDINVEENGNLISFETRSEFITLGQVGETVHGNNTMTVKHYFYRVDNRETDHKERVISKNDFTRFGLMPSIEYIKEESGERLDSSLKIRANIHNIQNGKKIEYYLTDTWPDKYLEEIKFVVEEWNRLFQRVTGRTDDVVVLHSAPEDRKNLGDPRYNLLVWVAGDYSPAPAGYGPSVVDPKTGEVLASRSVFYDSSLRWLEVIAKQNIELIREGCISTDPEDFRMPGAKQGEAGPCIHGFGSGEEFNAELAAADLQNVGKGSAGNGTMASPQSANDIAMIENYKNLTDMNIDLDSIDSDSLAEAIKDQGTSVTDGDALNSLRNARDILKASVSASDDSLLPEETSNSFHGIDLGLSEVANDIDVRSLTSEFDKQVASLQDAIKKNENLLANLSNLQHCEYEYENMVSYEAMENFVRANPDKSVEEMVDAWQRVMVIDVMLHEVGHNMGLMHNFEGSFDAANFPDKWREMRLAGKTISEDGINIEQLQTSTVMDYNRISNMEGVLGRLGKYDEAAIRFAYLGQVEQVEEQEGALAHKRYVDVVEMDRVANVLVDVKLKLIDSPSVLTEDPELSTVASTLYVKLSKAGITWRNTSGFRNFISNELQKEMNIRKYRYCTDWDANIKSTCNRHDFGYTLTDIMKYKVSNYDLGYYMNTGFRRDRRTYDRMGSGFLTRYVLPIRQVWEDIIWNLAITRRFPNPANEPNGVIMPETRKDHINAFSIGLGFLNRVLNQVDRRGLYIQKDGKGEFVQLAGNVQPTKNDKLLFVGLDYGKAVRTSFDRNGVFDEIQTRGVLGDKMMTILGLTIRGSLIPERRRQGKDFAISLMDEILPINSRKLLNEIVGETKKLNVVAVPLRGSDNVFVTKSLEYVNSNDKIVSLTTSNEPDYIEEILGATYVMQNYNTLSNQSLERTFDLIDLRKERAPFGEYVSWISSDGITKYAVPKPFGKESPMYVLGEKAAKIADQIHAIRNDHPEIKEMTTATVSEYRNEVMNKLATLLEIVFTAAAEKDPKASQLPEDKLKEAVAQMVASNMEKMGQLSTEVFFGTLDSGLKDKLVKDVTKAYQSCEKSSEICDQREEDAQAALKDFAEIINTDHKVYTKFDNHRKMESELTQVEARLVRLDDLAELIEQFM